MMGDFDDLQTKHPYWVLGFPFNPQFNHYFNQNLERK